MVSQDQSFKGRLQAWVWAETHLFLWGNEIYQTTFAATVKVLRLTHTLKKSVSLIPKEAITLWETANLADLKTP